MSVGARCVDAPHVCLIAALFALGCHGSSTEAPTSNCAPEPASAEAAPELATGLTWLNTEHPFTLASLRGSVVLLDFWTYGCINCLHQLPIVAELEDQFSGRNFVVIGVHSAKFTGENDAQDIELAIQQYDVRHPVVVDDQLQIWNAYHVQTWPTAVVVDAAGKVRYFQQGEYTASSAARRIGPLLDQSTCLGIAAPPTAYLTAPDSGDTSPLLFPTAVLALPDGRVAISDSSHDRVVVMQSEGHVGDVYGSGEPGLADGGASEARFFAPEGLAYLNGKIYVADAGNHVIRELDTSARTVATVAGTGSMGDALDTSTDSLPATHTALNSPWDLEPVGSGLAVALSGTHQLAYFDPSHQSLRWLSGTGDEGLVDGAAADCFYAQPSALSTSPDASTLYVADQESSAIRAVDMSDGSCTTLVGQDLFTFGDQDGVGRAVRLQHVSGVETLDAGDLLLADTYNSKIKQLTPATRAVETVDWPPPSLSLDQPRGLSRLGSLVYVADTNHQRVLVHDLVAGDTRVFDLGALTPPAGFTDAGAGSVDAGMIRDAAVAGDADH